MKSTRLRSLLLAAAFAVPVIAHAHPGHDGDHDFVWDFEHFVTHPLATIACVTIVAAGGWAVWQLVKSSRTTKAEAAKRTDSSR
jgi:hypothetical protein